MKTRILRMFIRHSLPLLFTAIMLGGGAMIISYGFAARSSEREAHNQFEQIHAYYEAILTEMDTLNLMFSTNSEIITRLQRLLDAGQWEWADSYDNKMIRSFISAPANAQPYIDSIYVYLYNDQGRVLTSQSGITAIESMEDSAWYDSFIKNGGHDPFRAEYIVIAPRGDSRLKKQLLRISRTIYNTGSAPAGVIVLNLLEERLITDHPSFFTAEDSSLIVRDSLGNRLLSVPSGISADFSRTADRKKYIRFALTDRRFGWQYELLVPRKYLYRLPRTIGLLTIVLSVSACILGLLLTHKTYKREQKYQQMEKEVLEYRALQMQINPHFLYNTLETINWKAVSVGSNDISRMIRLLSNLLKYSIGISENPGVPLAEEIRYTQDYLALQNFRFGGRFSALWRIGPALDNIQVPRLFFQPILENSFTHGFRQDGGIFEITIRIKRSESGDKIVFTIDDNGEGMDQQTLERLNAGESSVFGKKHSIGFSNIRKRITLFYKGKAEFSINSGVKAGTLIRICIPAAP
jgi:two-component system sensor histidine kinase YesM